MSTVLTTPVDTADRQRRRHLRRLHLLRFGFAALWAGAFALAGSSIGAVSVTLLVLYPVVDAVAGFHDLRSGGDRVLGATIAVSSAAAVGLAVAATDGIAAVLRVWGVWAEVAGLAQLAVALRRRSVGGQWALILSGSISVLAGAGFAARAGSATSMTQLAGYAALGGLFFLASAVRLGRPARAELD